MKKNIKSGLVIISTILISVSNAQDPPDTTDLMQTNRLMWRSESNFLPKM